MPDTPKQRLYADQLRELAEFLDSLPTSMANFTTFNYDSWFDVPEPGLILRDAKNTRQISVNWDDEAENWYVEVGDE